MAIVEDHDLLAQSLGFALSNLGIHVTTVADLHAEAVIETLEACELDLVLLDFDLGDAGIGLHLVRPITELGLRVVMLTGETSRDRARRVRRSRRDGDHQQARAVRAAHRAGERRRRRVATS